MAVNRDMPTLLDLIACPSCRSALTSEPSELACTGCGRHFPLCAGVPVLLEKDGEGPSSLLARLQYAILGNARVYDFQQAHFGGQPVAEQLAEELAGVGDATLLDIGAGTGMVADLLPSETRYIWLDNDTRKLRGLLSRSAECHAVLGDAVRLPFGDRTVDWTLMVEVSHHIPNDVLLECLSEAARVTRERFIFVDAVCGPRLRSKFFWQFDLGRFPRSEGDLLRALETSFELERVERFRGVNHDHVTWSCVPRSGGSSVIPAPVD